MLSTSLVCICRAVLNAVNRKLYIASNINNKIMLRQQSFKWVRNSAPAIKWQNCPTYAGRRPSAQKPMHPVRILCLLEPVFFKKQQKKVPDQLLVCGIGNLWRFWNNGIKLIPDDQGNHLDSYAISLESFRSFRGPQFRKPVTGQELFFWLFLTANRL